MSKSCIKCGKELGFRDEKWNRKHVHFWCATYWYHEIPVGDKTCDEPAYDMHPKDRICAMCYQAHCLEHHLIAMVEHKKYTNEGLLGKRKFKKLKLEFDEKSEKPEENQVLEKIPVSGDFGEKSSF